MRRIVLTALAAVATLGHGQAQTNRYVAGDWHQHTTYTDGSYSFGYQMERNNQFGLDWWANSEHGGGFNKFGRLSGTDADPLNSTVTWAAAGITPLGNNLGTSGNMWRWQSIRDYSFADVLTARTNCPGKVIIQGYEWNVPGTKPSGAGGNGHEHCSMGSIFDEFEANPNANVVAQFEYQFDYNDNDTSGDNSMGWVKSANANTTDAKMVEAAAWLQNNYGTTSWLTPAHPERKKNWTGATFRKLNDAAPSVAFGFESMPGHQRSANRGEYGNGQNGSNNSNGGGTYGGCGYFAAQVGGLWDSLLGEGRHFWLFTSSDSHEVASNDFYPGEYQKTYSYASDPSSPQAIVDGLRSGNSFIVQGDLIDSLDFKVDGAVMGSTLLATSRVVTVSITVHDPTGTNYGPAGYNSPTLDHIDLIAGEFGGLIPANDPAYNSESNLTTQVIARFDAVGGVTDANGITSLAWTDLGNGTRQMSVCVDTLGKKLYFRLRGSNLGLNVPGDTDGAGNPLVDAQGQNTVQKAYSDLWFYSNPIFVESRYLAGDFHQHTTYSDGSNPFATVMGKNNQFGLDWWANSEHGGKFTRNAAGPILTSGFDTGAYAQFWDDAGVGILGDPTGSSGGHTNMWRWQSLRDFSFNDVLAARSLYTNRTIIQGVEWNVPGHEHCSVGMIANEFGPNANANAVSMFEYLWDANDADTSLGAKTTVNDHAKAVAAVQWMQANYPSNSWMVPAHPERRGVQSYPPTYTGSGSQGYSVAAFRDLNTAGRDVCFGFESMPGHQKESGRGGYGTGASGGGTFGGCGVYAAKVGGLWDAMLGEGRHFWLFASSDFHLTSGDFWPGEYQKTYTAITNNDAQSIVNGLRSGNTFVTEGDLIDALDFTVGNAVMGSTLFSTSTVVTVSIRVHDPVGANNGPAGLNTPALDHLDVIAGQYGSLIAPTDAAYLADSNVTTRVVARFAATNGPADSNGLISQAWTDLGDGWKQMTLSFDTQGAKTYFRLRGSNLGLGVAGQTDDAGNPLLDPQSNTAEKAWSDLWFYSNPVFVYVFDANHPASLSNPANGAVVTGAATTLNWTPVSGATSYQVNMTGSNGYSTVLTVTGTSAALPAALFNGGFNSGCNGSFSWSVIAFYGAMPGLVSATGSFTLQAPLPALQMVRAGDGIQTSWPSAASSYVLEFADALDASNWQTVPQLPALSQDGARKIVTVTQPEGSERFYRLRLQAPGVRALTKPFMIVALPDTQVYSEEGNIGFRKQVEWVLANRQASNIVFVTHLGDVVDNGTDTNQWANAMNALNPLLAQSTLPFSIVRGNHDEPSFFLANVSPSVTTNKPWFVAASDSGLSQAQLIFVENACMLHIGFEKDPTTDELAWANSLLQNPNLSCLPVIVSTHDYIDGSGQSPTGRYIWDQFVKTNAMVFMVLNGHTHTEYALVNHNAANRPVYQMLSDYQDRANAGNGLMRLISINPTAGTIAVKTFSPYFNNTVTNYFETDFDSQFGYTNNLKERFSCDTTWDFGAEPAAPALPVLDAIPASVHFSHIFQNRRPLVGTTTPYAGTVDVQINENNATLNYGGEATLTTDMNDSESRVHAFLRFDGFVGTGPGQIPPGSVIKSANIVFNATSSTKGKVIMHRMLVPWGEHSTWMDFTPTPVTLTNITYLNTDTGIYRWQTLTNVMVGGGVQPDDIESVSTPDLTFTMPKPVPLPFILTAYGTNYQAPSWDPYTGDPIPKPAKEILSLDTAGLTATVQAWVNGTATNYGWFFEPTSSDGWDFQTAEGKQPPALVIEVEGAPLVQ
jgi:hypothetical protein